MGSFDQSDVARVYARGESLPDPLPTDPMPLVRAWFDEAHARRVQPNPNAMTLATVDPDGRPSARIVLCKGLDVGEGFLEFFTNYQSRKGLALEQRPVAAAVFHWDALDRQVRVEGPVTRSPEPVSDAYFATRPWESRVGAWASDQSRPVESRRAMLDRVAAAMRRLGVGQGGVGQGGAEEAGVEIPRPPHWGGYRLWAERVEAWASGVGRVHDRALWTRVLRPRDGGFAAASGWEGTRLQP